MIFAVLFDMSIKCVHDTAFISTHKLCMGLCGLDNHFTTIMKLKDLPNCLMASCKKQRPTIQRKEKLKKQTSKSTFRRCLKWKVLVFTRHYKSTKNFLHKHPVCHISKEACQFFSPVAPYTKDAI